MYYSFREREREIIPQLQYTKLLDTFLTSPAFLQLDQFQNYQEPTQPVEERQQLMPRK